MKLYWATLPLDRLVASSVNGRMFEWHPDVLELGGLPDTSWKKRKGTCLAA